MNNHSDPHYLGSALVTVLTTIFVRVHEITWGVLLMKLILSRSCSKRTCSGRNFPRYTKVIILTLPFKLNLEIPPYDFNEVDGKLVVG